MEKLIVKAGTQQLLSRETGNLCPLIFANIARQIWGVMDQGTQVILVTSGAIRAGREEMTRGGMTPTNLSKGAWAGVGALPLMTLWKNAFNIYQTQISQMLVTWANWESLRERENIVKNLGAYLRSGIVPVINENDLVAIEEIASMEQGIGENDKLARMVAELVSADGVLYLTSIGGVFDTYPLTSSSRKFCSVGRDVLKTFSQNGDTSDNGTGGILAKLREGFICLERGMRVSIAGLDNTVITRFASGESVTTMLGEETVV